MGPRESKPRKIRRVSRNLKLRLPKPRTQEKISPKKLILRQLRAVCSLRKTNMKKLSLKRRQKKSKTRSPKRSRRLIKYKRKKLISRSLTNLLMVRLLLASRASTIFQSKISMASKSRALEIFSKVKSSL